MSDPTLLVGLMTFFVICIPTSMVVFAYECLTDWRPSRYSVLELMSLFGMGFWVITVVMIAFYILGVVVTEVFL